MNSQLNEQRQSNRERLKSLKGLKKEIITFDEIQQFIDELYITTKNKHYTGVYGIPRAGLLLATLFSYKADIPLLLAPQPGCLVIDDDIGTGLTISAYAGKYDTAVMYTNETCSVKATYFWKYYDNKSYKVFAWNVKEDLR